MVTTFTLLIEFNLSASDFYFNKSNSQICQISMFLVIFHKNQRTRQILKYNSQLRFLLRIIIAQCDFFVKKPVDR